MKLPPEAEFINDATLEVYEKAKKKYDQTNQLITNDSITVLVGDYGYYDSSQNTFSLHTASLNLKSFT